MKSHMHAAVKKRISARERRDARNRGFDFESVVGAILNIHSECIKHAERAVSVGVTLRNWAIGLYIFEYEQRGSDRAQYGARVLDVISTRLTRDGVDGVASRSLRQYRQFYLTYPELCRQRIGASSSGTLSSLAIWQTMSAKLRELLPAERDPHNSMISGPRVDPEFLYGTIMKVAEIGHEIRRSRLSRGLTQVQLADAAHITRTTLNQLENGLVKDLGIRKLQAVLDQLGLALLIDRSPRPKPPDFLRVASTTASVSFKATLSERELLRALLTGKVPRDRYAHLRTLLEESPRTLMKGLIQQVRRWTDPGKLERNLARIAAAVGLPESPNRWMTND